MMMNASDYSKHGHNSRRLRRRGFDSKDASSRTLLWGSDQSCVSFVDAIRMWIKHHSSHEAATHKKLTPGPSTLRSGFGFITWHIFLLVNRCAYKTFSTKRYFTGTRIKEGLLKSGFESSEFVSAPVMDRMCSYIVSDVITNRWQTGTWAHYWKQMWETIANVIHSAQTLTTGQIWFDQPSWNIWWQYSPNHGISQIRTHWFPLVSQLQTQTGC